MKEKRGYTYLLTGALIGLALGLLLSLAVIPTRYINTAPYNLSAEARAEYRIRIAQAYLAEGDVNRALSRLALLGEANESEVLISQAQNMLAEGGNEAQARALALLAAAVNQPSIIITPLYPKTPLAGMLIQPTITPTLANGALSPETSGTPEVTATPRPTITPLPTQGSPFEMIEQSTVCDPLPETPLLQVTVLNAANLPAAGIRIEISQSGGNAESFYTGLYPEINDGYADYAMTPNTIYALRVGESGQTVTGLSAPACEDGGYGSLKLVFKQP